MRIDTCPFCRKDVMDNDVYYHEVTGWESTRQQGGANVIHLRARTGKKAHAACVSKAKHHDPGQGPLWNE
jgi:hypothetical protein